jgi:hypothetical protein
MSRDPLEQRTLAKKDEMYGMKRLKC